MHALTCVTRSSLHFSSDAFIEKYVLYKSFLNKLLSTNRKAMPRVVRICASTFCEDFDKHVFVACAFLFDVFRLSTDTVPSERNPKNNAIN